MGRMEEENKRLRDELERSETRMNEKLKQELEKIKEEFKEGEPAAGKGTKTKERKEHEMSSGDSRRANEELKWLAEEAERERKKKNLVISGLEILDKKTLAGWFALKLGAKVEVRKIWKIRSKEKTIGVQLERKKQKLEVIKNKSKLKDSQEIIYINNDLTWRERQNRKEVVKKVKELEGDGTECKVSYNRISTAKEEYFWNERREKWFRREKTECRKE